MENGNFFAVRDRKRNLLHTFTLCGRLYCAAAQLIDSASSEFDNEILVGAIINFDTLQLVELRKIFQSFVETDFSVDDSNLSNLIRAYISECDFSTENKANTLEHLLQMNLLRIAQGKHLSGLASDVAPAINNVIDALEQWRLAFGRVRDGLPADWPTVLPEAIKDSHLVALRVLYNAYQQQQQHQRQQQRQQRQRQQPAPQPAPAPLQHPRPAPLQYQQPAHLQGFVFPLPIYIDENNYGGWYHTKGMTLLTTAMSQAIDDEGRQALETALNERDTVCIEELQSTWTSLRKHSFLMYAAQLEEKDAFINARVHAFTSRMAFDQIVSIGPQVSTEYLGRVIVACGRLSQKAKVYSRNGSLSASAVEALRSDFSACDAIIMAIKAVAVAVHRQRFAAQAARARFPNGDLRIVELQELVKELKAQLCQKSHECALLEVELRNERRLSADKDERIRDLHDSLQHARNSQGQRKRRFTEETTIAGTPFKAVKREDGDCVFVLSEDSEDY